MARSKGRSKVVLVRHPDALDKRHRPVKEVIQKMLDDAVKALVGVDDTLEAWRRIVRPTDLVGIKSNVWHFLPTPKEVVEAIRRRLLQVGVPEERIGVDDRGARRTLAHCTALINARPLRTHYWAGIGGCLKNYIPFVPNPSRYHPDACADLGAIWKLPIVRGKTRLNVLVVLRPLFHGRGPHHFSERYLWDYKGLLVSFDPVAADAVGVELLARKRRQFFGKEVPILTTAGALPFRESVKHVRLADIKHGIGVSDLRQIDLVKIGWKEGILL